MTRDGPGGSVAVQLPSEAVVTAAASVNAFEPLSGAVRIATGWPASGMPALLISRPCSLTGRPNGTRARVGEPRRRAYCSSVRGSSCCRLVVLRDLALAASGETATARCSRKSRRRGSSRPRPALVQQGREAERVRVGEAQTGRPLPTRASLGRPCRTLRGRCSSIILGGPAWASRSGELPDAHLRDGLGPGRQHHASDSLRRSSRRCRRI